LLCFFVPGKHITIAPTHLSFSLPFFHIWNVLRPLSYMHCMPPPPPPLLSPSSPPCLILPIFVGWSITHPVSPPCLLPPLYTSLLRFPPPPKTHPLCPQGILLRFRRFPRLLRVIPCTSFPFYRPDDSLEIYFLFGLASISHLLISPTFPPQLGFIFFCSEKRELFVPSFLPSDSREGSMSLFFSFFFSPLLTSHSLYHSFLLFLKHTTTSRAYSAVIRLSIFLGSTVLFPPCIDKGLLILPPEG